MPSYTMINKETGEEHDMVLSLAEREEFLADDKWEQKLSTAKFVADTTSTLRRAGSEWNNMLGRIKSNNPNSTINN
ncbi:MAG TPA: hypothetical protein DCW83_01380 [Saprospirales bacterium]|jgi:hypothetical protein|nr:hypothetical protein [Saprospirales bacterium]